MNTGGPDGRLDAAPEVSVIVPCYNAAAYVGEALRSIMVQGVDDVEIIVVDDGSTDDSAQRVRQTCSRARVIQQANAGVAAARNTGIAAARGAWIAFLDADDLWLPGKLAAQLALVRAQPGVRMCYTGWHVWFSDEPQAPVSLLQELARQAQEPQRWQGPSGWIYPELLLDCEVWTSTVLLHRDLITQAGGFNPALRIGEDYDLWLRLSRITPIVRLPMPGALYRMHPSSITRRAPERNWRAEVVSAAIARWGYASPDGRLARQREVQRVLARSWADFAAANLLAGSVRRARQGARHALHGHPMSVPAWKVLFKSLLRRTEPAPAHDG